MTAAHGAGPEAPPAATATAVTELRHGYTLDSLSRLARWTARRKLWAGGTPLPVKFEVAWSAMAEYLYAAAGPPAPGELIEAGWQAIRHHGQAERQYRGRAHDGPAGPGPHFERY